METFYIITDQSLIDLQETVNYVIVLGYYLPSGSIFITKGGGYAQAMILKTALK